MRIRDAYIEQCRSAEKPKREYVRSLTRIGDLEECGYQGRLSYLGIAPGKSLGMLPLEKARFTPWGLSTIDGLLDRSFMVAEKNMKKREKNDPDYVRFSQRQQPQLSLLIPSWNGSELTYEAPGTRKLIIERDELSPREGPAVLVEVVPGEIIPAIEENGHITEYIRKYLGRFRDDISNIAVLTISLAERPLAERFGGDQPHACTRFSDGGQMLLTSTSSLEWISERMRETHGRDVRPALMHSIRPNIVIDGWPANLEDILASAVIQGAREKIEILFRDPCVRCKITQVDDSGEFRSDKEPFLSFLLHRPRRFERDGSLHPSPTFGVNVLTNGLAWGLDVHVEERVFSSAERERERFAEIIKV